MFLGLQLGHVLFGAAENTSIVLQRKYISVQEAFSAVNVTRSFYQRQRQDDAFNKFYESVVKNAQALQIGEPMLPRYRTHAAQVQNPCCPGTERVRFDMTMDLPNIPLVILDPFTVRNILNTVTF